MGQATDMGKRGFTLVELLVVLGIVMLLTAIALPGLARLGAFSRDEYRRTVQEASGLLRAAQIYSTTYHVNTAVVYTMDNWSFAEAQSPDATPMVEDPGDLADPVVSPVIDSITGNPVRQIRAAAIMYELPGTSRALSGHYVPIPGPDGAWREFPQSMAILLQNPEVRSGVDPLAAENIYLELGRSNFRDDATENLTNGTMGLVKIPVALGIPVGMNATDYFLLAGSPANFVAENFGAHVFQPSGRMTVASGGERFTFYIGPSADRSPDERLIDPAAGTQMIIDGSPNGKPNMMYRKIHVFKSTGRTEIPKNF